MHGGVFTDTHDSKIGASTHSHLAQDFPVSSACQGGGPSFTDITYKVNSSLVRSL